MYVYLKLKLGTTKYIRLKWVSLPQQVTELFHSRWSLAWDHFYGVIADPWGLRRLAVMPSPMRQLEIVQAPVPIIVRPTKHHKTFLNTRKTLWTTCKTSWNTYKRVWNIMKQLWNIMKHCSMRWYQCLMWRHRCSSAQYVDIGARCGDTITRVEFLAICLEFIFQELSYWRVDSPVTQEGRSTHFWEINIFTKTATFVISVQNLWICSVNEGNIKECNKYLCDSQYTLTRWPVNDELLNTIGTLELLFPISKKFCSNSQTRSLVTSCYVPKCISLTWSSYVPTWIVRSWCCCVVTSGASLCYLCLPIT